MAASAPSVGLVSVTPTATACGWLPPCTHVDFVRAACTPGSCWLATRNPAFRVWLSRTPAYGELVMLTAIGSPLAMAVASAEAVRTDLKLAVSRTAAGLIKSWRGQGERSQILRFVQPSLIGLIDGTISTLAPIFAAAYVVVGIELITIAWVRRRFLHVPLHRSLIQVTMGGFVVAGLGALIGHA